MSIQDGVTNRLVHLENAFGRVFLSAMDWAEEDFRREIEATKWNWPNETERKNGERVGSPRDIVDTGQLRDSQRRENVSEETTDFVWTGGDGRAYALEVHDGYTSRGGNRMPARPFTDETIAQINDVVNALIVREVKANG